MILMENEPSQEIPRGNGNGLASSVSIQCQHSIRYCGVTLTSQPSKYKEIKYELS